MARYSRVALYRVQNSAHDKHGNPIYFRKSKYNPEQIVSIPEAQREEPHLPLSNELKPGPPVGHPEEFPGTAKLSTGPVLKKKSQEVTKAKKSTKSETSGTMKKTGKMKKLSASPAKKAASKKGVKKMASKKMSTKKMTGMKKASGTKKAAAKKSKKTKR